MDVAQAIRLKRAVRSYAARPLPEEAIQATLLAGRRAQSAKNTQPWHFIAVQERSSLEALGRTGTFAEHLAGAPLAVVILTPDPAQRWSILFDAGQAAALRPVPEADWTFFIRCASGQAGQRLSRP